MTVMPEQSSEDDTEMTAFEVEETKLILIFRM